MITSEQCSIEVSSPFQTPFTNPLISYDVPTSMEPASSFPALRRVNPGALNALQQVVFLSALAFAAPAIPLNSLPGESSSLSAVRYVFARPRVRRLSLQEARLMAMSVHLETESLIRKDRLAEAKFYSNLFPESDD